MDDKYLTVTQINRYIKYKVNFIDGDMTDLSSLIRAFVAAWRSWSISSFIEESFSIYVSVPGIYASGW